MAANSFDMRLINDRQTVIAFSKLKNSTQLRAVKPALSKMGTILNKAAKAETSMAGFTQSIGALKRAIGKKSKRYGLDTAIVVVGARKGQGHKPDPHRKTGAVIRKPYFYAHLVEGGAKGPPGRGPSRPKPFLGPAFDKTKSRMIQVGRQELKVQIEKMAKAEAAKMKATR